uniref:Uncharacterized protein n=1 Tax=Candidatus Kentrum sp. MB TaxID=2138164 RepID=A0A450XM01_9GAMM|nr:MAG: hypothetical protein BECKMB1821I_GA0114274_10147 [Candidatus Kentron sp. MB]VFK75126.1 MAG: hypothetical protein BECKMB1821H_GA0114242_10167 [Candidatus Kentron sp. MB]
MANPRWNATDIIEAGKRHGIYDLQFLLQDKLEIYSALDRLGLPRAASYYFSESDLVSSWILELFDRSAFFCRLIPKGGGIRPYREKISSIEELKEFCAEYDLAKYTGNLVETNTVTHTGAIIATDDSMDRPGQCVVEFLEGTGPDLFHGHKTPTHVRVERFSRVLQFPNGINKKEKRLIMRALRLIGGPENPFPGYYEFEIWKGDEIMYRNYQAPSSMYAKLTEK